MLSLLTVMAMVFSLFSGVAFAANSDDEQVNIDENGSNEYQDYSRAASSIVSHDNRVDINENSEFTVRFRSSTGARIEEGPVKFYINSSRDAEKVELVDGKEKDLVKRDGENWEVRIDEIKNGEVKFTVTSSTPGEYDITLYRDGVKSGKIDSAKVRVNASDSVDKVTLEIKPDKVTAGERFTLKATATADKWEVEGAVIVFEEKNDRGRWVKIGTARTDKDGVAELRISKTEIGDHEFQARWDKDRKVNSNETVEVKLGDIDKIVAHDRTKFSDIKDSAFNVWFAVYDEFGNRVVVDDKDIDSIITVRVTAPDGKVYTNEDRDIVELTMDLDDEDETYEMFQVKVFQNKIDEDGKYKVEARIGGTTLKDSTTVTVSEFGKLSSIEIHLDETTIRKDYDADEDGDLYARVFLVDNRGMKKNYDIKDEDVIFSSSNSRIARVGSRTGLIDIRGNTGETEIKAYHADTGFEDSVNLYVAGEPEDLEIKVNIKPGNLRGNVTLTMVDEDGNRAVQDEDSQKYNIVSPEGIRVSDKRDFKDGSASFSIRADEQDIYSLRVISDQGLTKTFKTDFTVAEVYEVIFKIQDEDGKSLSNAQVVVKAREVDDEIEKTSRTNNQGKAVIELEKGKYDYTVTRENHLDYQGSLKVDDDITEEITLGVEEQEQEVKTKTIKLTEGKKTIEINGQSNQMDSAPIFSDGRSYLPFRVIGEALGATVDWDSTVRSVTARLDDTTVVFYINETVAWINGEKITMDAAPYLDQEVGRTLLPIRFIAEAFDANVTWSAQTREIIIVK